MKTNKNKLIGYGLIVILGLALISSLYGYNDSSVKEIPLSQVVEEVSSGRVDKIIVKGDELIVVGTNGVEYLSRKEPNTSIFEAGIDSTQVIIEIKDISANNMWLGF